MAKKKAAPKKDAEPTPHEDSPEQLDETLAATARMPVPLLEEKRRESGAEDLTPAQGNPVQLVEEAVAPEVVQAVGGDACPVCGSVVPKSSPCPVDGYQAA